MPKTHKNRNGEGGNRGGGFDDEVIAVGAVQESRKGTIGAVMAWAAGIEIINDGSVLPVNGQLLGGVGDDAAGYGQISNGDAGKIIVNGEAGDGDLITDA